MLKGIKDNTTNHPPKVFHLALPIPTWTINTKKLQDKRPYPKDHA